MVVSQFPPAHCGGAEMQCWQQARALVARGHEVTVLTEWFVWNSARREMKDGVEIRRLGFFLPVTFCVRRIHRWLRLRISPPRVDRPDPFSADHSPREVDNIRRFRWLAPFEWLGHLSFIFETAVGVWCHQIRADIVHVHESHWVAGFAQWIAEQVGVPVFCKEACGEVLKWPGARDVPWLEVWKRRRMKCRYIAITPHIRMELERAGVGTDQIDEIPNGVDIPKAMGTPGSQEAVVYAGNFSQGAVYKAFDILLQAWGEVHRQEPRMRLRLFGGGGVERWKQVAEREGCGDSVEFAGQTSNLSQEFLKAGFLVLPSRVEGLSNVLLEAQAAGLPAVVSDIGGNVAVVENRKNGVVVPVGDARALANAMLELFRSPELRAQMGHEARIRIQEAFSIQKVAEQLEAAYIHAQSLFRGHST